MKRWATVFRASGAELRRSQKDPPNKLPSTRVTGLISSPAICCLKWTLHRQECVCHNSAGGKEKLQEGADALGPSGFVVFAAFDALVVEVGFELPALADEDVAEALSVLYGTATFACAGVEPDARMRRGARCGSKAQNDALVPPDGRRKRGDAAKDLGHFQA